MVLLGVVVVLWVSASFLTFAIFSDNSYQKPYFLTYFCTSTFCLYLIPTGLRNLLGRLKWSRRSKTGDEDDRVRLNPGDDTLSIRETMRLSAEFCLLWFIANYFSNYCLEYTTVPSSTILSSTSSMFTLIFSALLRIEKFTYAKLLSVLASLIGIALISSTDLSPSPSSTGRPLLILLGDAMALFSAFCYAAYITLLKIRVGDESRVNMQLFFGFVGLFNFLCLWPGLFILHWTDIEPFTLPPDRRVWTIVLVGASITLISDFCWAYAMLLTTPLIVTVGLSLTIPLALLGQMVLLGSVAGGWYWVGAACVFAAFWFLNRAEEVEQNNH